MNIVEVMPISRSVFAPKTLSYFSTKSFSPGDLASIQIRNKKAPALVKSVRDAKQIKSELRRISFGLKPLEGILVKNFLSEHTARIIEKISGEMLISEGILLFKLIPKIFLSKNISPEGPDLSGEKGIVGRIAILKGVKHERIIDYRAMIREHFAKGKSLMLISPRIEDIKYFEAELGRNMEEFVFSFSSELTDKKYEERFKKMMNLAHPVLIIGTPQALLFYRADLNTIIIDDEGSPIYFSQERPFVDYRRVAEIIAISKGIRLIFSGEVLRIETIWKAESGDYEMINPPTTRIHKTIQIERINWKPLKNEEIFWLSPKAIEAIDASLKARERILIFVNRRGYSSFTICLDCKKTILCPNCSVPLILHAKKDEDKKFLCHRCLKVLPLTNRCPYCSSWRLRDFGLGIEKINEEFRRLFSSKKCFILEREFGNSRKYKTAEATDKISQSDVTLATEAVLSYPDITFDLGVIVSLDNLFSIPDFRMNEKIFRLISGIKEKIAKTLLLQSRLDEASVFDDALAGNIFHLYQDEINIRRILEYPPFSKIILLEGRDANIQKLKSDAARIVSLLGDWLPISFPAFIHKEKKLYRWNIIIKLDPTSWPSDEKLRSILLGMMPNWQVIVDPESIL